MGFNDGQKFTSDSVGANEGAFVGLVAGFRDGVAVAVVSPCILQVGFRDGIRDPSHVVSVGEADGANVENFVIFLETSAVDRIREGDSNGVFIG